MRKVLASALISASFSMAYASGVIVADSEVALSEQSFGCRTIGQFNEAAAHYTKGEYSAFFFVLKEHGCFVGADLVPNQTWTVLQVDDVMMQVAITTAKQYVTGEQYPGRRYWTATFFGSKK